MSVLADWKIKQRVERQRMIEPFIDRQVKDGCISYGLSSYGYDLRVGTEFQIFSASTKSNIVDPKNFSTKILKKVVSPDYVVIPPNSFALARSVEYFRIPRDIITLCIGKSTYARCGILVNTTPFEPEWEGFVTLEISNTTPLPAKIYANEGLAQVLFFQSNYECEVSYAERAGKYQNQQGIVTAKV